jgi:hypothetical protein
VKCKLQLARTKTAVRSHQLPPSRLARFARHRGCLNFGAYEADAQGPLPYGDVTDHGVGAHIDLRNEADLGVGNEHKAAGRADGNVAWARS